MSKVISKNSNYIGQKKLGKSYLRDLTILAKKTIEALSKRSNYIGHKKIGKSYLRDLTTLGRNHRRVI